MRRGPFLLLFALSGAAALVYEVVWTRLLALQFGHGLAAASTVLAAASPCPTCSASSRVQTTS